MYKNYGQIENSDDRITNRSRIRIINFVEIQINFMYKNDGQNILDDRITNRSRTRIINKVRIQNSHKFRISHSETLDLFHRSTNIYNQPNARSISQIPNIYTFTDSEHLHHECTHIYPICFLANQRSKRFNIF